MKSDKKDDHLTVHVHNSKLGKGEPAEEPQAAVLALELLP